jgi:hypothetical protein
MGKDPLVVPSIPPGMCREGDMLGKNVSLKFLDHDITDEWPFMELAREKYSGTESVPDARARIASNINLYTEFNGLSNRFGGYECFMTVNEKESDRIPLKEKLPENWLHIRFPN